jgi:hypothetical protein
VLIVKARISRTGWQDYPSGAEYRAPEEVFAKEALDSFVGIPIVIGHVEMGSITPANAHQRAVGFVRSVEREDSHMRGVLVLTDPRTIERVKNGSLGELSAGYGVEMVGNRQTKIRGDHLALLPAGTGRCGRSCSIDR